MVTLTETAGEKLKTLMVEEQRQSQSLRLAITQGGCSGFSYRIGFDDGPREGDIVLESQGIQVVVDPISARYLDGVEVDYVESLMGGGFAIRNPNAVRTCGCGQSFRTAEEQGEPEDCATEETAPRQAN